MLFCLFAWRIGLGTSVYSNSTTQRPSLKPYKEGFVVSETLNWHYHSYTNAQWHDTHFCLYLLIDFKKCNSYLHRVELSSCCSFQNENSFCIYICSNVKLNVILKNVSLKCDINISVKCPLHQHANIFLLFVILIFSFQLYWTEYNINARTYTKTFKPKTSRQMTKMLLYT